jgi:hypothetical protein
MAFDPQKQVLVDGDGCAPQNCYKQQYMELWIVFCELD